MRIGYDSDIAALARHFGNLSRLWVSRACRGNVLQAMGIDKTSSGHGHIALQRRSMTSPARIDRALAVTAAAAGRLMG